MDRVKFQTILEIFYQYKDGKVHKLYQNSKFTEVRTENLFLCIHFA